MIVIEILNSHTNRQKLTFIKDWKQAIEWADNCGGDTTIHNKESLLGFVKRVAKSIEDEYIEANVHVVDDVDDPWDLAKSLRKPSEYVPDNQNQPENLQKSESQDDQEDKDIQDRIYRQLGGETRFKELENLQKLSHKLQNSVLQHLSSVPVDVQAIRAHIPEAKDVSDNDIHNLLTHGLKLLQHDDNTVEFNPKKMSNSHEDTEYGISSDDFNATNLHDLLSAYKESPHNTMSDVMKYIVHRIHHLPDYDIDKAQSFDDLFTKTGARAMNPASLQKLHAILLKNPNLITEMLKNQRDQEQFITQNFPGNINMIDSKPHVAISRGLFSKDDIPKHGEDYTLASYADTANPAFGDTTHRYWVPLSNIWNHYDLHPTGRTSKYGSENELIVDKWHPRYPASEFEVKHIVPRGIFSTNGVDIGINDYVKHLADNKLPIDHIPVDNILKVLKSTYLKQGPRRHVLDHKDITGDHINDMLAEQHVDFHKPMNVDFNDVADHKAFTTEHKKQWLDNMLQAYEHSTTNGDATTWSASYNRSINNMVHIVDNLGHLMSEDQKHRLAKAITDGNMSIPNVSNEVAGSYPTKERIHNENRALQKLFAHAIPDSDTYLRPNGSSKQESLNMAIDKPSFTYSQVFDKLDKRGIK